MKGLDETHKIEIVQRLAVEYRALGEGTAPPEIRWVPFVAGRRPVDEAAYPGLGSSDHVAMILGESATRTNRCFLLYRLDHHRHLSDEELSRLSVRLSLSFAGPWAEVEASPLPSWSARIVGPRTFRTAGSGAVETGDTTLETEQGRALVIELSPEEDLVPGRSWRWTDLDAALREMATDSDDPFTFGSLFSQQVRAEIVLSLGTTPISASEETIDVCDTRRFGSLYRRVVERVVVPDTRAQATTHGLRALDPSYHPWYPVLLIGSDKAELYTRALVEDIVHKKRHLTDPRWLLRVGLYLEFITCLGIFEAVRRDLGDLLSPAERRAYETSAAFAPIRAAVDAGGWKDVWALRHIVMPRVGTPKTGDVSALNLLAKKKATLAFLEKHHQDLQHAIELAGPNEHSAQETWHRVFRDAERAVLRKTPLAFPEVGALPRAARDVVLWHHAGSLGGLKLPVSVSSWFGDQDGLYTSACVQYRTSMNHVAEWARRRGLMDYAGDACVPEGVSLFSAFMKGEQARFVQLQRRDGYAGSLDIAIEALPPRAVPADGIKDLLRSVPLFRVLHEEEIHALACSVRPIELGPIERIIVQGRPGSSLFVLAEGSLEVLIRQQDGHDLAVATLERGAVFGEMSLLTGSPRSATVRSIDAAVVYEIGRRQLAPIIATRPTIIEDLASLMRPRVISSASATEAYDQKSDAPSLTDRIRALFLS